MKELWDNLDTSIPRISPEAPRAILSDSRYSIRAFDNRIEIWDLFPGAPKRITEFTSIENLVKSIRL